MYGAEGQCSDRFARVNACLCSLREKKIFISENKNLFLLSAQKF